MVVKTLIEKADNVFDSATKPLYLVSTGFILIGYITMFLGVSYISPNYIRTISNITYILIAFALLYKFNPLRQVTTITEHDSKLISSSAGFILFNLGVTEYALTFFSTVKNTFGM
jgi:hypothetical protein